MTPHPHQHTQQVRPPCKSRPSKKITFPKYIFMPVSVGLNNSLCIASLCFNDPQNQFSIFPQKNCHFCKMQNHLRTVLFFIHFAQVQEKVQDLGHPLAHHRDTYLQVSPLSNFHVHAKTKLKPSKLIYFRSVALYSPHLF